MKLLIGLLLSFFSYFSVVAQSTIWVEDFSGLADGTTQDNGATAWSSLNLNASSSKYWEVRNNRFEGVDLDIEASWSSELVDISNYQDVSFSIDLSENGSLESSDYIRVAYKLDGGSEVQVAEYTNDFGSATVNATGLNGNTLQIIIRAKCSSSSEKYRFDNVLLEGTLNVDMSYVSSTATQNTNQILPGSTEEHIIGIQVETNGTNNPLAVTSFSLSTDGSTNPASDINKATLYYTSTNSSYATGSQFGSTVDTPNGTFTFNGSQTLAQGINYFWLAYDIAGGANLNNVVDAILNNMTIDGMVYVPSDTNPTGNRKISNIDCGAYPVVSEYPYTESFESGLGSWTQGTGDDFDWTHKSGSTSTDNTGPSSAANESYYLYTEASNPNNPSKTANLVSPCFNLTGMHDPKLYFSYHLYGSEMGTLYIEVQDKPGVGSWVALDSISGNQGNQWDYYTVDLAAYIDQTVKVRFRGLTGNGTRSDMAIDEVVLADKLLTITQGVTEAEFTQSITGTGVSIQNLTFSSAHVNSYGLFDLKEGTQIGEAQGIVMSTGDIRDIDQPNRSNKLTTEFGTSGNSDLNAVSGKTTYDASFIEFDVVPSGDTLSFNYTFLSEEYTEYENSNYNDAFAFLISGPGISGEQNIALIPGTSTPVSINTVNSSSNLEYFVNNDIHNDNSMEDVAGFYSIEFDGYTVNLVAKVAVQSCETYHIKWIIGDGTDRKWDSGVFVEGLSSNDIGGTASVTEVYSECVEDPVTVTFERTGNSSKMLTLNVNYGGSMIKNIDYVTDNLLNQVTFLPGETTKTITLTPTVTYEIPNQTDSVTVSLSSCSGSEFANVVVYYKPKPDVSEYDIVEICQDGQALVDGGTYLSYQWKNNLGQVVSTEQVLETSMAGNYTLTVTNEAGCSATSDTITIVKLAALEVFASADCQPVSTNQTQVYLNASGGGGEYQYKLSSEGEGSYTNNPVFLVDNGTTVSFDIKTAKGCFKSVTVTTPNGNATAISNAEKTGQCILSGFNSFYDILDDEGNLIASISDLGNDLGVITASVYIDGSVQSYNGEPYLQRHYKITPQFNGQSARVRLYFTEAEFQALATANPEIPLPLINGTDLLGVSKYDGDVPGSGNEMYIGGEVVVDGFASERHYIEFTVPSFSSIYIHSAMGSMPLPVRLLSFTAETHSNHEVALNWETVNESNNKGFEIERSEDGKAFTTVGFVEGKNNNEESEYIFVDREVQGTVYYRLKQIDYNGDSEYSDVESVSLETVSRFAVQAYPNPFTQSMKLQITNPEQVPVQVQAFDSSGRPVFQLYLSEDFYQSQDIGAYFQQLSRGIYLLKVTTTHQTVTLKVQKQ
ncbi:choice-of-anchor L domain-containing protein [Rapidithrix thailandica]|uniref:Choice-of-anchor L domain-containing protein n=1 Tax=Rapidithrix thailandica TaxID=413964 RepID=A0AAW9S3H5_9BACT